MRIEPLRRYKLRPGRILTTLGGALLIAVTIFRAIKFTTTHSTQQSAFPVYSFEGRIAPHLVSRANNGNNAIANWLGYDTSYLSRPLSQLDAKGRAVRQGHALQCMMKAQPNAVAASPYQDVSNLITFGYRASFTYRPDGSWVREYGLTRAFADLGIPSRGFVQVNTGNSFAAKDGSGKNFLYPASYATFSSDINPQAGVIVATQSYGPEYMAKHYGVVLSPGQSLTPLQKVSDLLFLSWKKLINDRRVGSLRNLEHMFRWNSIVPEVQALLGDIAGGKTIEQIGEWPGVSYPIIEVQPLATLSSPNAKGVGWLLGQHKDAMGVKTVDRVNIFNCPAADGEAQWCVYLHIVAV